jgi:hypothetical protein
MSPEDREARELFQASLEYRHPIYQRMARDRKDYRLARIKENWPNGPLSEAEEGIKLIIRWVREGLSNEQIKTELEARYQQELSKRGQPRAKMDPDSVRSLLSGITIGAGE